MVASFQLINNLYFKIYDYSQKLMVKKLDWSERYCVEKFLPLLTKFHLQERVPSRTVQPIRIKKKRNPRGKRISELKNAS